VVSSASKLPVKPSAVTRILRDLRAAADSDRPLVVTGAPELVTVLARELARGGVGSAVRERGPVEGGIALVHILAGPPDSEDESLLKEAARARMPIVVVTREHRRRGIGERLNPAPDAHIPYVLDENVVRVGLGSALPIEEIATRLVRSLGEAATPLAARLPVLRRPVCEELIRKFSRQNGLIGVVFFVPGTDFPVLTLNQVRLVLRIADAYGFEIDRERLPEVLAVIGSGLGFRSIAHRAVGLVPIVGWVVKGGIAYVGTRALGEAAMRYFERRAPVTRVAGERTLFPR
jgi:uncharacterized protein (DUF697 family)